MGSELVPCAPSPNDQVPVNGAVPLDHRPTKLTGAPIVVAASALVPSACGRAWTITEAVALSESPTPSVPNPWTSYVPGSEYVQFIPREGAWSVHPASALLTKFAPIDP